MADLRQYIDGRSFFPAISQPADLLSCHRGPTSPHPYDMLMFRSDSTPSHALGFGAQAAVGGDGGAGRWPRQETLTLLEIRSRLDPKFKEANQKGPLWDEVSRIMSEENGYQRSGKKCREKFENLYKYYKKTKEGKAGRQDGKHYRFFRQLEALYGETSNAVSVSSGTHFHGGNLPNSLATDQEAYPGSKISDTSLISAPDSCDYDITSSYCSDSNVRLLDSSTNNDDSREMKRKVKRRLKAKIEESIETQMKSMMEKQEAWMEKMTRVIESKERERAMREEQWRKQDAARIEREHEMWASERAWIEARDAALMDSFNRLAGKELEPRPPPSPQFLLRGLMAGDGDGAWAESEVSRLIQLRTGMDDLRFQENEEAVWAEIATKMGRSSLMCREKWDQIINDYLIKCTNKRKDNAKSSSAYSYPISDHGVAGVEGSMRLDAGHGNSGEPINDGFLRYFMGESYQRL